MADNFKLIPVHFTAPDKFIIWLTGIAFVPGHRNGMVGPHQVKFHPFIVPGTQVTII